MILSFSWSYDLEEKIFKISDKKMFARFLQLILKKMGSKHWSGNDFICLAPEHSRVRQLGKHKDINMKIV